jgi:Tetratricopeptide repeat
MREGEVPLDIPEPHAANRQDGRGAARQPAAEQALVERTMRRSTVWLRHAHRSDGDASGYAAISNRTREHDRTDAAGRKIRSEALTGDVAAVPSGGPGGATAEATSRREISGDPVAMLLAFLSFPSRLALSTTASMVQLPLRLITGPADEHPGPRPGESRGTLAATAGAREPAADPASSAEASSAAPCSVGDSDRESLSSAHSLAHSLRSVGDYERARSLDEDILAGRRRLLGDDHPDTLSSAHNLAIDLSALGEHETARTLAEDTLARRRRVLGDDPPGRSRPRTIWHVF